MRALTTREMLDIWERGEAAGAVRRSLELIALSDGTTVEHVMALGIGVRNAKLLDLREAMLGQRLEATAVCPNCGEAAEFAFETGDLRAVGHEGSPFELAVEKWRLVVRSPICADLIGLPMDTEAARHELFQRCILSVEGPPAPERWPPFILEESAKAIAARDPRAHTELDLACAACGHRWLVAFNIAQFLWAEIAHVCRGLINEVVMLARSFGWSEAETLALSTARRRKYLEAALR